MDNKSEFNLEEYLARSVSSLVKNLTKSVYMNAKVGKFMLDYAMSSYVATKKRHEKELDGEHIPAFLIASIANSCNLHCTGCYARANNACFDEATDDRKLLNSDEWGRLFSEAEDLGISFIFLAGGEPMQRTDVLSEAGKHRKILFPIITNGTLFRERQLELLTSNPNLIPVISIEGEKSTTDKRRGDGIFEKITATMEELRSQEIVFGASITVTKNNMMEVFSSEFVDELYSKGCKGIIYIEFVPVDEFTRLLAPDDNDRNTMKQRLDVLRKEKDGMLLISFPGDEKKFGGCLAAGRGFFHINAFGFAEPCPFSRYSDTNVKEIGIRQALKSPLFTALNEENIMNADHIGGCVLYEKRDLVESLYERIGK